MSTAGNVLRIAIPVAVAGLIAAFFGFGLQRYLTLETLRDNGRVLRALASHHPLLAPATFVIAYASLVALSVPGGAVMTIAGGFVFGLWKGAALAIVGATAGAVLLFVIARFVVGDALRDRAAPFIRRMTEGFNRNAFAYLLFLRLLPAFPFWVVNLVPALIGVRLRLFASATLIGIIPGTLAYASVGDGLGRYFTAKPGAPLTAVFSPEMIAVRVGLALLALLPVAIQWLRKRRS
ncbi:MAG TPA: TVP38/TMEM64 family protein [Rhizomicrobium sp.]|jgi:uncharacterized membrane protein YdjX (TVP38/TMEM64 family)